MNNHDTEHDTRGVGELLRALAEDDAQVTAPAELRGGVMASWDARNEVPANPTAQWRWASIGRLAAAALIVIVVGVWLLARAPFTDSSPATDRARDARRVPNALPIDTALTMATMVEPPLETESLQIVRVRMPRGALRAFGVALLEPDATAEVEVDLIVGDDGFLRSIQRVQPVSMTNQERIK